MNIEELKERRKDLDNKCEALFSETDLLVKKKIGSSVMQTMLYY